MNIKYWMIIKDDTKRTFEVNGPTTSDNFFTNKIYAMQKAGMNVSGVTPPVTNKTSSKGLIKIPGYAREDGLYERLLAQHSAILRSTDHW
ncbi:MAG TPA: hypothetical protein VFU05_04450 [Cyclobacteriaceae bacterium]|nr:hypothetical protein [Cyclobacteriaceae bacterium]